jgi:ATP-binding cassette, subfamily B, bacterial
LKTPRLDYLLRALGLVWRSSPRWTIVSVILVVIEGLLPLLSLYLMKLVLDAVTIALTASDKETASQEVLFFIALAGGVALLGAFVRTLSGLASSLQGQVVTDYMYGIIHAKAIEVDLAYYENSQYQDTLHRAQREAYYRPYQILMSLIQLGRSSIALLGMAGLLISLHWGVVIVLLVAILPGIWARFKYAGEMYQWQRERTADERRARYFDWLLINAAHAKENRLFGLGHLFMNRFQNLRLRLRQERLGISIRRAFVELGVQMIGTVAVFGAYAFIAYRTVQGSITLGDLVMYFQAFQRGQGFLTDLSTALSDLYEDNLFLTNLYEFLDQKPELIQPLHPTPVPRPMRQGLVFQGVSFGYRNAARKVLQDINLNIKPGQVIALVGENGSGKTTLIKLLCRLYDVDEGCISIDGVDIRQFDSNQLRREISVIFQDYARYQLTVRDNIWLGNVDTAPEDSAVIDAARRAGAEGLTLGLKHGYDTVLGNWFEDGQELSIGEWQKIALARAFMRDSQIIIFDEPTSAMDAKAEHEVFQHFRQLIDGRAAVIISHRLSTIKMADYIYVLDQGQIAESGTHNDLMRLNGKYASMFETQAQYYR